jgi:hypothetical protein
MHHIIMKLPNILNFSVADAKKNQNSDASFNQKLCAGTNI